MEYRSLGRTGVQVSPLCLGTMTFGARTLEAEGMEIVDVALDAGINFFDTADVYGQGASEDIVGKALQRNGKRQKVVLATKVHGRMDDDPNAAGLSRRHIIEACENSLKRLQTDYIDLYQTHVVNLDIPLDETLRALDDLIQGGKVRYIGCSNIRAWEVVESLWAASQLGLNRYISVQPSYNMLDRILERDMFPMAKTHGMAILPWSPLSGGFLTGKYKRGEPYAENTRMTHPDDNQFYRTLDFTPAYDLVDILVEISQEKDCSVAQLALAWCINQPGVTSPIVGVRTVEQLKANLGSLEVEITDEDRKRIDAVSPPYTSIVPYELSLGISYDAFKYPWFS